MLLISGTSIDLNQEIHKVTSTVTSLGAWLCLKSLGISLRIPKGAIPKKKYVDISLSLSNSDDLPPLDKDHSLICPVVKCEPEKTKFSKPAILTLPSYAVEDDERNVTIWTSQSNHISSSKRSKGEHF